MKNIFFDIALNRAARFAGKPGRIISLLAKFASRARNVDWKKMNANSAKEQFFILTRLVRAYADGRYRHVEWKSILLVVAAVIYFLNPIDLVPDFLPLLGLTDDVGIVLWVFKTLQHEIQKFLTWEQSQVNYENSFSSR